jgi:small-conductance mechanosensitive channel
MFFNYSEKVGNRIEIIDGANTVSGVVANVTLFNFQIEVESGDLVTYPNNLIIQKPILKLSDKK